MPDLKESCFDFSTVSFDHTFPQVSSRNWPGPSLRSDHGCNRPIRCHRSGLRPKHNESPAVSLPRTSQRLSSGFAGHSIAGSTWQSEGDVNEQNVGVHLQGRGERHRQHQPGLCLD